MDWTKYQCKIEIKSVISKLEMFIYQLSVYTKERSIQYTGDHAKMALTYMAFGHSSVIFKKFAAIYFL